MSYRLLLPAVALVTLAGCGKLAPREEAKAAVTTAAAAIAAKAAPDDDDEEPKGSLVLRDDVLARCPEVSRLRGRVDEDLALDALRGVGECMAHGPLRGARVFVRGSDKATRLFDEALARVGVKGGRVERMVSNDEADDHRVEVGLTPHPLPGHKEYLSIAVRKSQVVGFVMGEMLLD